VAAAISSDTDWDGFWFGWRTYPDWVTLLMKEAMGLSGVRELVECTSNH